MKYNIETYAVGGSVRDELMGLSPKDRDYTVVVNGAGTMDEAWSAMRSELLRQDYHIFLETSQYLTIRAKFPKDSTHAGETADFVLARAEGPYSDNRHPDWVKPGTLEDDLSRRDFTVNAMAKDLSGRRLIDPFNGRGDLEAGLLRAVGVARERLLEDPLRAFRALRFAVVKGFTIDDELKHAMKNVGVLEGLKSTSTERISEELRKAFAADTEWTMNLLVNHYPELGRAAFDRANLWLKPTMEKR